MGGNSFLIWFPGSDSIRRIQQTNSPSKAPCAFRHNNAQHISTKQVSSQTTLSRPRFFAMPYPYMMIHFPDCTIGFVAKHRFLLPDDERILAIIGHLRHVDTRQLLKRMPDLHMGVSGFRSAEAPPATGEETEEDVWSIKIQFRLLVKRVSRQVFLMRCLSVELAAVDGGIWLLAKWTLEKP